MKEPIVITRDLAIICAVIAVVFITFYWNCIQSGVPLDYGGDSLSVLMGIQGNVTGENTLLSLRSFHRLNAPFVASWADYPFEKIATWEAGLLSRWMGLALGTTLAVLLLQLLAGISFYCAGRVMRFQHSLLVAGAVLFGLAPYAFLQNLQHLTLTAYWHLPLLVLTLLWFGWPERVNLTSRGGLLLGCTAAFIAGNLNPYYLGPFLVLLSLLVLGVFAESPINWRKLGRFAAIVLASILGFLIQNFDTLFYAVKHGRNSLAVSRDLWWMVKFGLTLPDLIFPRAHQNALIDKISTSLYHAHVPSQLWGESQTAYIGMVSVLGVVIMIVVGIVLISARKFEKISPFFWLTSGTLLFSLMGGVNYLLGAFGFLLLRATNRASILLSCMALYFLCENIPQDFNKRWGSLLAAALILIGIWDQLPRYPFWEEAIRQHGWSDFKNDQEFFARMEKALPQGGMVFELPVKDFPEMGPIREMGDYEHFRPVIHTKDLRFSYGTVKGRGDIDWQYHVASENPETMLRDVENMGFCAILINRKAYEDHGENLRKQLLTAHAHMLMENPDFLIFNISASLHPVLPPQKTVH